MSKDKVKSRTPQKYQVGQIVVLNGKKNLPFRILDAIEEDGGWFYAWNRKNYASEHMIRELSPEEKGEAARPSVPEQGQADVFDRAKAYFENIPRKGNDLTEWLANFAIKEVALALAASRSAAQPPQAQVQQTVQPEGSGTEGTGEPIATAVKSVEYSADSFARNLSINVADKLFEGQWLNGKVERPFLVQVLYDEIYGAGAPAAGSAERWVNALATHWLSGVECNHANKTDKAMCACSQVALPECASVGQAIFSWIEHVKKHAD